MVGITETVEGDLFMTTNSGRMVSLCEPKPEQIDLNDIALGLCIPRYCRHTRAAYTVAQHSVWVHDYLSAHGADPMTCMLGLMHDAPEYVLGDDLSPKKWLINRMAGFDLMKKLHDPLMGAICTAFELPWPWTVTETSHIKHADLAALSTECRDLRSHDVHYPAGLPDPWGERIVPLTDDKAMDAFLSTYHSACDLLC